MSCDHSNIYCYECGSSDCACAVNETLRQQLADATQRAEKAEAELASHDRIGPLETRRLADERDAARARIAELRQAISDYLAKGIGWDEGRILREAMSKDLDADLASPDAKGAAPECHNGPLGPCDLHPAQPNAERPSDAEVESTMTLLVTMQAHADFEVVRRLLAYTKRLEARHELALTSGERSMAKQIEQLRERAEDAEKRAHCLDGEIMQMRDEHLQRIAERESQLRAANRSRDNARSCSDTFQAKARELREQLEETRLLLDGAQAKAQMHRADAEQLRADLAKRVTELKLALGDGVGWFDRYQEIKNRIAQLEAQLAEAEAWRQVALVGAEEASKQTREVGYALGFTDADMRAHPLQDLARGLRADLTKRDEGERRTWFEREQLLSTGNWHCAEIRQHLDAGVAGIMHNYNIIRRDSTAIPQRIVEVTEIRRVLSGAGSEGEK